MELTPPNIYHKAVIVVIGKITAVGVIGGAVSRGDGCGAGNRTVCRACHLRPETVGGRNNKVGRKVATVRIRGITAMKQDVGSVRRNRSACTGTDCGPRSSQNVPVQLLNEAVHGRAYKQNREARRDGESMRRHCQLRFPTRVGYHKKLRERVSGAKERESRAIRRYSGVLRRNRG